MKVEHFHSELCLYDRTGRAKDYHIWLLYSLLGFEILEVKTGLRRSVLT